MQIHETRLRCSRSHNSRPHSLSPLLTGASFQIFLEGGKIYIQRAAYTHTHTHTPIYDGPVLPKIGPRATFRVPMLPCRFNRAPMLPDAVLCYLGSTPVLPCLYPHATLNFASYLELTSNFLNSKLLVLLNFQLKTRNKKSYKRSLASKFILSSTAFWPNVIQAEWTNDDCGLVDFV